jgi:hypothetical protein
MNHVRKGGLLNRQKRPYFIAAWAYNANGARENQKQEIVSERESQTGSSHQNGADDEHAPSPNPVRASGEIKRDNSIPDERQRKQQACLGIAESKANQVEN